LCETLEVIVGDVARVDKIGRPASVETLVDTDTAEGDAAVAIMSAGAVYILSRKGRKVRRKQSQSWELWEGVPKKPGLTFWRSI
jgi:hypothetical protein